MFRTINVRRVLNDVIRSVHPRAWYERAPDDAEFPYLTYELPSSIDRGELEPFILEVDGWDAPSDGGTMALESLMAAVDGALERRVITAGEIAMVIYRDRRLLLGDDDDRIRRRKYIYEVRTIGRKGVYHAE